MHDDTAEKNAARKGETLPSRFFLIYNTFFRLCEANGNFGGEIPECKPISCGLHPIVENGIVEPELSFLYLESVNISCVEGYHLTGTRLHHLNIMQSWKLLFIFCR